MVMINSEIKGLRELAKNVDALKPQFARSTLRTALRNAAQPVRKRARDTVPVDEGDLKRAIGTKATVKRSGYGFAQIGFDKDRAHYGGFVELGTSQRAARPYLRPALEEAESSGEIQNAFIEALNNTIEKRLAKNRRLG